MKITAYWLHAVWDDVTELERGQQVIIDPVKWDRNPHTIVQGINRVLRELHLDRLIKRVEFSVSVIDGKVRVRRD